MCGLRIIPLWGIISLSMCAPVLAQQRPLETQDPDPIEDGKILVETGVMYLREQVFTVSGLHGDYINTPGLGFRFGVGGVAEFQVTDASYQYLMITERFEAPRDHVLAFDGNRTSSFDDLVVGAKVRLLGERSNRPSLGMHFSTRLSNASDESGLGKDTFDFHNSILVGKTIGRVRTVFNLGLGILGDPTNATRQNDVLLYGVSIVGRLTESLSLVGEVNGHRNTRSGEIPPGTDSTGLARTGLRYMRANVQVDGAMVWGLYEQDAKIGATIGISFLFDGWDNN